MVDVVLSSDSLTILGGPSQVSVDADFGPRGDRGSYILVGYGKPNDPSTIIGETPQIYDLYINVLSSDDEYLYIYQYLNTGIAELWVRLMKLTPNSYSLNTESAFVDGQTVVNIPVARIVPSYPEILANITAANFNVQYSITNQNPMASSMSIGELVIDPLLGQILQVTINATEFDGFNWINLVGNKVIHLYITVV